MSLKSENKDKNKDLVIEDKDLQTSPRWSSRTRTFLEDNNSAGSMDYGDIDNVMLKTL